MFHETDHNLIFYRNSYVIYFIDTEAVLCTEGKSILTIPPYKSLKA